MSHVNKIYNVCIQCDVNGVQHVETRNLLHSWLILCVENETVHREHSRTLMKFKIEQKTNSAPATTDKEYAMDEENDGAAHERANVSL